MFASCSTVSPCRCCCGFFRQVANLVYRTNAPRLWRIIWSVPAFVTILALIFTDSYLESSVDSGFFLFCRIGLLVCVFAIYYVLLQSLEGLGTAGRPASAAHF